MGMGPIPWSHIKNFAEANELSEEETGDFAFLIRFMDRAHMKHNAAERDKKTAKPEKRKTKEK